MSLPTGQEKTYLEITPIASGFAIHAVEPHAGELQALFRQYGITFSLHPNQKADESDLIFSRDTDVAQVEEILDAY